jgi:hypothetical protein
MRSRARAKQKYALSQGEVVLGGVAGGLIDGTMGEGGAPAEIFGLPVAVGLGGLLTLAGFTDMAGAEHAGYSGVGLLSYGLGNMVREQLETG